MLKIEVCYTLHLKPPVAVRTLAMSLSAPARRLPWTCMLSMNRANTELH